MTIVKELNELAEKITGTNPRATTDAQAMNYIEQNYSGGGSSGAGAVDIIFDNGFATRYVDMEKVGRIQPITNELDVATMEQIENVYKTNPHSIIRMIVDFSATGLGTITYYPQLIYDEEENFHIYLTLQQEGTILSMIFDGNNDSGWSFRLYVGALTSNN